MAYRTHDLLARLSVEALGEHGDHEDVDEEGHEERDGGLGEKVHVGLLHLLLLLTVYVTRLTEKCE